MKNNRHRGVEYEWEPRQYRRVLLLSLVDARAVPPVSAAGVHKCPISAWAGTKDVELMLASAEPAM